MSVSFEVVSPETIAISLVTLWPVLIKFVVKVEISLSLLVIWVCKVCPVVTRLPALAEIFDALVEILLAFVDISLSLEVI